MKDYELLFQRYHLAIQRIKELEDQAKTRDRQWYKLIDDEKASEVKIRALCEFILANDREEMKPGGSSDWNAMPLEEMIRRTMRSFDQYMENTTSLMKGLMEENQNREAVIYSQSCQIEQMMAGRAGKNGTDSGEGTDQDEKTTKSLSVRGIAEEESDFVTRTEEELEKELDIISEEMKAIPSDIPFRQAKKRGQDLKRKNGASLLPHTIDLVCLMEGISEPGWKILEVIGREGLSVYTDIENRILGTETAFVKTSIRNAGLSLETAGILHKENIRNPIRKRIALLELTDAGSRVFREHFGTDPVPSQMSLVAAEHDNYEHGYGIIAAADCIRAGGYFTEVCEFNRAHPIELRSGVRYIPDIICRDETGDALYIEYELGNTGQTDFNGKCSKMFSANPVLNFLGSNREAVQALSQQCARWIKSKGRTALRTAVVRIAGCDQIKDADLRRDDAWKIIYRPGIQEDAFVNY